MKKKSLSKLVLKLTEGLVARAVDLVLLGIFYFTETIPSPPGTLRQKLSKVENDLQIINYQTLKRALLTAQEKGWITRDLKITKEGEERLKNIVPKYWGSRKWDGNWYFVTYDIPEGKKKFRDILRENLKRLGFGRLHKSVWISPNNFLGNIEKIVKNYNLSRFVLLGISNKLGRESSIILANRIWNIEKLNKEYQNFIRKAESKKLSKREIIFDYLLILEKDPQLPKEFLPSDWLGEKANKIFRNCCFK